MPAPANLVHQTATTTGTGNFTLAAVNGKQSFATAFSTGVTTNVFDYFISNREAAEWERGTGHMSDSTTLVRDTVIESTNANAAVSFSAGTKDVMNDVPAAKQVTTDTTQTLTNKTLTDPIVGTQTAGDSTTKAASTAFVTAAIRKKLLANATYYVRTDGSDSNDGLANTAGGAFLTVQKAIDTIATLDIAGFTVTIQIGDGTYTGAITLKDVVGYSAPGCLVIQGNNSTPANVVISTTSANAFTVANIPSVWDIKDLKIQTTTSGSGIRATGAKVRYGNVNFGACATGQVVIEFGGYAETLSSYTVSGGSMWHWFLQGAAILSVPSAITITVSGTPAFSFSFISGGSCSYANAPGITFSGSATGKRYSATLNGVINTNGGGANYFPGDVAGTTATGGLYS